MVIFVFYDVLLGSMQIVLILWRIVQQASSYSDELKGYYTRSIRQCNSQTELVQLTPFRKENISRGIHNGNPTLLYMSAGIRKPGLCNMYT